MAEESSRRRRPTSRTPDPRAGSRSPAWRAAGYLHPDRDHLAVPSTAAASLHTAHSLVVTNRVRPSAPPRAHAKPPRSSSTVCWTSPPSRTRTQLWCGTSAYQTEPSASTQMPSGTPPARSAHSRPGDRLPSARMSKAVKRLPYDSATIRIAPSGDTAIPFGNATPSATRRAVRSGPTRATRPGANSPPGKSKPVSLT